MYLIVSLFPPPPPLSLSLGFGSILSPSGDEDGSMSDQESPLSLSSSCKGSRDGINTFDEDTMSSSPAPTDGETDFIEEDLPSPSHDVNKGMLSLPPPRVSSTASKKKVIYNDYLSYILLLLLLLLLLFKK